MNDAATITLIIVSSVVSIFLILFSLVLVDILRLVKQIRKIAERAETVASSVESAANAFEKSAGPIAALKLVASIVENVRHHKSKKGE